ncbi:MAG: DNA mismatch repair protein MutS [Prevotellaceae bacterium]|jgi:DNA mismatch repair protein MutS|nr:DNA mismatch repair protein MutS [Prevotellaceae bacterium]
MSKNERNRVAETPLMKQYYGVKAKHPDALLLFRVGDFYETFGEDAIKTSDILGITLTKRANGTGHIELAGFPYHAMDTYLPKLVRAGQRVAICDQLEDPKSAKTIVKRGVTELVTPGVSFNSNILEHRENNFLACVHLDKTSIGVAFLDISTGEFYVAEGTANYVDKLLSNFMPKEILFQKGKESLFNEYFGQKYYTYKVDEWFFVTDSAREKLLQQFQTTSLKGFGIEQLVNGQTAAGAILYYLELTQHNELSHIVSISRIEEERYVWLDKFTIRNLELFGSQNENAKSLLNIIDKTISPMGARLLRRWIALPLKEVKTVNDRLNVVDFFMKNPDIRDFIYNKILEIGDIERIISKTSTGRVNPKEVIQLKIALQACVPIKNACLAADNEILRQIGDQLNPCSAICEKIGKEIVPEPAGQIGKGIVVAEGVNQELDGLRNISSRGKEVLAEIQQREIEATGIPSLKVSFNNVFGYYIEVRNTHKNKVPHEWIRKQTLVDAERYITEELKQYEAKILGAEEKILILEQQIYSDLITALVEYITPVQMNANLIAQLDCLLSFAELASKSNYCKPVINNESVIDIKQGRHPVVEKLLPPGEKYIANDLFLDRENQQIIIITGPNMSGKSAILRQTALIVLLAQIGCFVPAQAATIGIVDKIFTRVGASDNISQGESTFMVEMNEAASILNNLSDRSLILLDEIGRGTSTYDGISIAWALVEYIHEHPTAKAKTLFATHYHELNEMENSFARIKNYNVTVKEMNSKVIFLRKLVPGGVAHSFGIHVARMAGMPKSVVTRSEEILKELEKSHNSLEKPVADIASHREGLQLSFFQLDDPVLKDIRDKLKKIDINSLTPIEALNKLNEIKKITGL